MNEVPTPSDDAAHRREPIPVVPVGDDRRAEAFAVLRQLRDHLDFDEFVAREARQRRAGYEMYAALRGGRIVGLVAVRQVETMARGAHLHVDDLVVDGPHRRTGVGGALLAFAERCAAERGMSAVFLDARPGVEPFYEARGYRPHTALLMRKGLAG